MDNSEIKEKIMKDLGEENAHKNSQSLMDKLSRKYDVSDEVLEQTIAEWSAGREKIGDDNDKSTEGSAKN